MNKYPLIRFVLILIAGIAVESLLKLDLNINLIIFLISFLFLALFLLFYKNQNRFTQDLLILVTIFSFGALYLSYYNRNAIHYPFPEPKYSNARVEGVIKRIELKKEGRINLQLYAKRIFVKDKMYTGDYSFYCSVYDENNKTEKLFYDLSIGNRLELNGNLQRPRDERNPGEFDYEKYLNGKGIAALLSVYNADSVKILSREKSAVKNLIFEIRKIIDEKIERLHNKTTAALLRGLILADRGLIDYQINDYFINAGVVHVLSVSGLHVGYIVIIFIVLFSRFGIYTRFILTAAGLIIYMILTGSDAPVFRSTVMAIILLVAPLTGRDYNSFNTLSFAALIILMINPNDLFNPSFQLSFSAIMSLILLYPPLKAFIDSFNFKSKIIYWFLIFCVSSIAAQLGTLPFTLTYFHRLSVTSLAANMLVIPLSGAIVALGIFTVVAGSVSFWIGSLFASANEAMTYFLYWFVKILGKGGYSYISIRQFTFYDAVVFYLALLFIFMILKKELQLRIKILSLAFMLIASSLLMRLDDYKILPDNTFSLMAIDVGQGDSFLIRFPDGKTALIDAGNKTPYFDNGEKIIIPLLDRLGIDTLDYGFISHVDADHYKGFESIIKAKRVVQIFKPHPDTASAADKECEKFLRENNYIPAYYSRRIISVGSARIYVLNDTINDYFGEANSNDLSGYLKIVYGYNSFLFTGDGGVSAEKKYARKYESFLKSDLLKTAHHGSRSGTSELFLDKVNPEIAVISAGIGNKFKHPSRQILERLAERKIKIIRTDEQGALLFYSNGYKIEQSDWRKIESRINF